MKEITISFELASEAPGVNEVWPSDIHFHFNNKLLGFWTSPGDFGEPRGLLTPAWWHSGLNQFGFLKLLSISKNGTYMDGIKMSDVTVEELELDHRSEMALRLSSPRSAANCGGLTIFGKGFGNYNQGILIQIRWEEN